MPIPTPAPGAIPLVSNGTLRASGSNGVTLTFALGSGVPVDEFAVVSVLPPPPPCVAPACTAVAPPLTGIELTVQPQPLDVRMMKSVAFAGITAPFQLNIVLADSADALAFTNFWPVNPAGGPLVVTDPASIRPVLTLVPNHTYSFAVYETSFPPT